MASDQPPYSIIQRRIEKDVLPFCRETGIGVICYSPMQAGILTDTFSRARLDAMAADDWRLRSTFFQEPNLTGNLGLRDRLRPIAARHETSVASVAVEKFLDSMTWVARSGWVVSTPVSSTAILTPLPS